MTNSEYFEKNNVSFADAMKLFNGQKKIKSFGTFLASEYNVFKFKFKIGDLVVLQLNKETRAKNWDHNVVFEIVSTDEVSDKYKVKHLTPTDCNEIGGIQWMPAGFLERNTVLY